MMLRTTQAVQNLLDLEDAAPDVLFERIHGSTVPLWPIVRMSFAGALVESELGDVSIAQRADPWRVRRRLAKAYLPWRWDARNVRDHRDLCYVLGGGTISSTPQGARNWLVADFLDAFPQRSLALQWRPLPSPSGAPAFTHTYSLDPVDARAGFRARRRGLSTAAEVRIDELTAEFAVLAGGEISPGQLAEIRRLARRFETFRPLVAEEFDRILDRVNPRVILMEDASYGHHGALIAQFKRRGILVAEPQHGWIGPSHAAYNHGAAMRTQPMLETLPDELLTFGTFWSDGVRHPGCVTAIGKPHLESMASQAGPLEARPHEVLLVSSISDPESTTRFCKSLVRALDEGWRVRFRPHPSERSSVTTRYADLLSLDGVLLDANTDVYDSLRSARVVVGAASTVLYEALAMGCAVLVRDTPWAPFYVGDLFGLPVDDAGGADRIAEVARQSETSPVDGAFISSVWHPGSVTAFTQWAHDRLSAVDASGDSARSS